MSLKTNYYKTKVLQNVIISDAYVPFEKNNGNLKVGMNLVDTSFY